MLGLLGHLLQQKSIVCHLWGPEVHSQAADRARLPLKALEPLLFLAISCHCLVAPGVPGLWLHHPKPCL